MSHTPRIDQSVSLLRVALRRARRHHRQDRASRIQRALNALRPKPKKPRFTANEAIANARKQSEQGPQYREGMCLQAVRECYGIPAVAPDAISAWQAAKKKHRETDPKKIPPGKPVFYFGGSEGHGHIDIQAQVDSTCFTTDIKRPGFFDHASTMAPATQWGLTLLGWTDDLNGHPIP